jgi:hypothetical protein
MATIAEAPGSIRGTRMRRKTWLSYWCAQTVRGVPGAAAPCGCCVETPVVLGIFTEKKGEEDGGGGTKRERG